MSIKKIKWIINQYFDNELTKNEEVILFTQLSQDERAREYFKEMNLLRTTTESTIEEYPDELDDKIFSKIKRESPIVSTSPSRSRLFTAISYSLAIVLLALSIFFYNESIQYRNKLELTYRQVNQQNQMIQVLFNSLPQAEVRGKFIDDVILIPQM